ncbi:MFS transporter, partial [Methanocalculus sp.]|uniref:MFS transporter n=1 Tax=Methanocalculus sp. TaxID=2004547 RepID=UPI00271EBA43
TAWILPTVMLVGAVILLAVGSLGDIIGKRRVILICLLVYGAGVLLGGFAPDMLTLLLSRMLQGVGLAVAPLAYALVAEETPPEWVSTGIGVLAATYGAGSFLGIMTGAFIIEHSGWRACFLVMTPFVMALIISAWFILPKKEGVLKGKIDLTGMALFAASILFGMLALTQMGLAGIRHPFVWICLSISIISLILFLRHEKRVALPLLDIGMIREAPFPAITINAFLVVFSFFILLQVMPYLIASPAGLALAIVYVGILLMPGSLMDMVSGPLAGYIVGKKGVVLPFVFGSIALLVGCGIFFLFPLTPLLVVCIWMIFSAGMSILLTIDNMIAVASAPPGQTATASAFLHTIQSIGGAIGPIVAGAALTIYPGEEAFSVIFLIVLGVTAIILFQSVGIRRHLP